MPGIYLHALKHNWLFPMCVCSALYHGAAASRNHQLNESTLCVSGSELLHLVSYCKDDQTARGISSCLRAGSQRASFPQQHRDTGHPKHSSQEAQGSAPACVHCSTGQGMGRGTDTQRHRVTQVRPEWLSPGFGPIPHEHVQDMHKWVKAPSSPQLSLLWLLGISAHHVQVM